VRYAERMPNFEKLDAYRVSIELTQLAFRISDSLPRGYSSLADQLRRAAMSVPLNIAEGHGKTGTPDRKRYYAIARGSVMECFAILDVARLLPDARLPETEAAKELADRAAAMLSKMSL